MFHYYQIGPTPVVLNSQDAVAWAWRNGEWREDPSLAHVSYRDGVRMSRNRFVHEFPEAALRLLEMPVAH